MFRSAVEGALRGRRSVAFGCAVGLVTILMAVMAGGAGAASAPDSLYAYASGGASSPAGCPHTATVASQCTLAQAIGLANSDANGATIYLETQSGSASYSVPAASSTVDPSADVTIEPGAGVSATLDGTSDYGSAILNVTGGRVTISANAANGGSLTFTNATASALLTDGAAALTIDGVTFSHNTNGYLLQVLGLGNETVGGAINDEQSASGTLTVKNSTFSGNTTSGGLAQALSIGNQDSGGAIYVDNGTVTITNSTFHDNENKGLIAAAANANNGGAIAQAGGTVNVSDSTFSDNTTANGVSLSLLGSFGVNGGAIANLGGSLNVSTSTFANNSVEALLGVGVLGAFGMNGDAIYTGGGTTSVNSSTFSGNNFNNVVGLGILATLGQGADFFNADGATTNVAGNIFREGCSDDTSLFSKGGTLNDAGYNVATDASCTNGGYGDITDATASSLALGTLQDNGGPTQTMEPGSSSVALAVIPTNTSVMLGGSNVTLCPTTDQRGVASNGACSAGSVQPGAANSAPTNTTPPSITGTPGTGKTVACTTGTWTGSPAPTYKYQWYDNGNPISGATSATYTIPASESGDTLTCEVIATNSSGSGKAKSPPVTVTSAPSNTTPPSITGTPTPGSTLTCTTGTWTGSPAPTYKYQWYDNGNPISGATGSTYQPTSAEVGDKLTCEVIATNSSGSGKATSPPVTVTSGGGGATAPTLTAPTVSGTPRVGRTLTCTSGTVTGSPTPRVGYQWDLDGKPISGATGTTFQLVRADAGHTITCVETAKNKAGSASATSNKVKIAKRTATKPVNTKRPRITGTVASGSRVTCTTGTWTGTRPLRYSYQWYLDGSPIPGATGSAYNIPASQEGETLSCSVTATNRGGSATARSSGVKIPVPVKKGCPAATGSLNGLKIAKIHLGETMSAARRTYEKQLSKQYDAKGFIVCFTPHGMRVEHPTAALLRAMPAKIRAYWANRAVLIMTTNAHYSYKGVRPTTLWSTAKKHFKFVAHYKVHGAYYYVIRDGKADIIIKVEGKRVYGIGTSVAALQKTKRERNAYQTQYWSQH